MGSTKTVDVDQKARNDLLELIKLNPVLYDRSHEHFDNQTIQNALWLQLGELVNLSVPECQAKFKCQLGKFGKIKKLLEGGFKITPNQFNFLKKYLFFNAYFTGDNSDENLTYEYFSDDDEFDDPIEVQNTVNLQKFDTIDCLVFNNSGKFETIEEIRRGDLQVPIPQKFALDKEIMIDYEQPSTSGENRKRLQADENDHPQQPPRKRMRANDDETTDSEAVDSIVEESPKEVDFSRARFNEKKYQKSLVKPERQVDYTFGKYVAQALMCFSPVSKAKARVDIDKVLANSKLSRKF